MKSVKLGDSEYRLMNLIWDKEPISAKELAEICLEKFDWKKTTVYTMIKRMGDKGVLVFENKMVTSLMSKEQVNKSEGDALLQKAYDNSVSEFFAAFLQDRKLSKKEAERIKEMIEEATRK